MRLVWRCWCRQTFQASLCALSPHSPHDDAGQIIGTEVQVASTPQQRASLVRAGLAASTRHAAAHRSRTARVQATAVKRHAPPPTLLARRMQAGQAPRQAQKLRSQAWKHHSRRPRIGPSRKTTQPSMLRAAAREAQQVQSRSHRALTLARRRAPATRTAPSAVQSCAQREDQTARQAQSSSRGGSAGSEQDLTRLDIRTETQPGHVHHPQRTRAARARAAAQRRSTHADEVSAVASDSQHDPLQGSPGMPKQAGKQESPHDVEAPATPQLHAPPTAVPAEEFSQKGFEGSTHAAP